MEPAAFLDFLRRRPWYVGQISHVQHIPPKDAVYGALRNQLHPLLEEQLASQGLLPLYHHQTESVDAVLDGQNVVVVTPAASGKSLCYHVPIAQALLEHDSSRALYLFPAKALAQDQHRGLRSLLPPALASRTVVFDGDTPQADRSTLRRRALAVLTNPDMLHFGILPNHQAWSQFFASLRYVVVDEAHVYRGVFGSHVANVIRRLRRICKRYQSSPQFILSSATIANAAEFAERLTGQPVTVVDEDGAAHGGKRFVFWNPPVDSEEAGVRRNANREASQLVDALLRRQVRTLAFVRTRRQAELVYVTVRESLQHGAGDLAGKLRPYRASYMPEERRQVERGLHDGGLLGVVATNALELGIDIGGLDATVLTGYPGSIASTWQQAGRSGRSGSESLSMLVAQDNPLDQFLMRHPQFFFGRSFEHARISPENPHVLRLHLQCAAYELPLAGTDAVYFGESYWPQVEGLQGDGLLQQRQGRWYLNVNVSYPAQQVNIRSAFSAQYLAVEAGSGRVLEQVEEHTAFNQLHPGAVYLHQGETYLVERLDQEAKVASLRASEAPYYTHAREIADIRITSSLRSRKVGDVTVNLGEVKVSHAVVGFQRKSVYSDETLGDELLDLPVQQFPTVAFWFDIPQETLHWALRNRQDLAGGLHAMEHAAIGVLPLFALCDRNDIGGVSTALHPDTGKPQVFIYDGHPGGVGIAEHGYDVVEQLWATTLDVVRQCPCTDGCPSCIHSPKCGNNNHPLDKATAIRFLQAVVKGAGR